MGVSGRGFQLFYRNVRNTGHVVRFKDENTPVRLYNHVCVLRKYNLSRQGIQFFIRFGVGTVLQ